MPSINYAAKIPRHRSRGIDSRPGDFSGGGSPGGHSGTRRWLLSALVVFVVSGGWITQLHPPQQAGLLTLAVAVRPWTHMVIWSRFLREGLRA